ncbi:phospholipid phosphatase [Paenibacillus dendritiformis]|uniref:phospholipid phosphatase n=1 Tax=Paenibacillus dendritiformis TaxID=130049 RepID=UPI001F55A748|nr:phospholipid phosphatase [Paenibacillus dendritiformis]MBG9793987.1 phospholipid phosphatase [Paenibacillus dendritiformis]
MQNTPWWTRLASLMTTAALTSLAAGGVTFTVLAASDSLYPLRGEQPPVILPKAQSAYVEPKETNEHRYSVMLIGIRSAAELHHPGDSLAGNAQAESVRDIADRYKRQLAKNEPFTDWREAGLETIPLGPGMHGWLVRVISGQEQIGYMILEATEQGEIRLAEYGRGSAIPYQETTLHQALAHRLQAEDAASSAGNDRLADIEPCFFDPLLTVWRLEWSSGEVEWLDAQSGEWLPPSFKPERLAAPWSKERRAVLASSALPSKEDAAPALLREGVPGGEGPLTGREEGDAVPGPSSYREPFDPYHNILWMTRHQDLRKPESGAPADYKSKRWVYVQQRPGLDMKMPFAYIGMQRWEPAGDAAAPAESKYVIISSYDKGAMRWIPAADALANGYFIPQS